MNHKRIIGTTQKTETSYFINAGDQEVEVPASVYFEVMESLMNGDVWIYSEQENKVIKYGTQLKLF